MKIETTVNFDMLDVTRYRSYQIRGVEDVKGVIQCRNLMIEFQLLRKVIVSYPDFPDQKPNEIITDRLNFIAADALMYQRDVNKYIKSLKGKVYVSTDDYNLFDNRTPVFFRPIWSFSGDNSGKVKCLENQFRLRPLNDKDIVVNNDLEVLWGTKKGKNPILDFLSKTTEKVNG